MQLPEAYRSLPRPSSPLRPQASAMRPYFALKFLFEFFRKNIIQRNRRTTTLLTTTCKLIAFPICQRSLPLAPKGE